jgi:hypothetical protein
MGKSIEEILKQIELERSQRINEDQSKLDEINNQRDLARKEWNKRLSIYESISNSIAAGGGSSPSSPPPPPPPPPPSSPYTILEYLTDQGAYVAWDENAFNYDPTLPNFSYTLDTNYIPTIQVPTPAALTAVQIGNLVTDIGALAFYNCAMLTSVTFATIPVVTSIGNNSFENCSSLTSIAIPTSVTSIAGNAFLNSGLTTVTIANGQLGITSPDTGVSFFGATVNTVTG